MDEQKVIGGQEAIRLSPEQMELVRQADLQYEQGEALTPQEVRELARNRTKAWIQNAPGKTA
jgi:hypothetical protein